MLTKFGSRPVGAAVSAQAATVPSATSAAAELQRFIGKSPGTRLYAGQHQAGPTQKHGASRGSADGTDSCFLCRPAPNQPQALTPSVHRDANIRLSQRGIIRVIEVTNNSGKARKEGVKARPLMKWPANGSVAEQRARGSAFSRPAGPAARRSARSRA